MASLRDDLRAAIDSGDLAAVERVAKQSPEVLLEPLQEQSWRTDYPVTAAAIRGQAVILSFLLGHGGDATANDHYPLSPAAVRTGTVQAMEVLIEHGADVNGIANDYGPPLIWAIDSVQ